MPYFTVETAISADGRELWATLAENQEFTDIAAIRLAYPKSRLSIFQEIERDCRHCGRVHNPPNETCQHCGKPSL